MTLRQIFNYTLRFGQVNWVDNVVLRISACVFLQTLKSNAKKVFLRIVAGYSLGLMFLGQKKPYIVQTQ